MSTSARTEAARVRSDNSSRSWQQVQPSWFRSGRIIPLSLVVWFVADIGLRLLPLDWLEVKPHQDAIRLAGPHAPFRPNLTIYHSRHIGELALLSNTRPTETRPPIHFSTDHLGFRRVPGAAAGGPEILVMEGDSFTYGTALSDDETFPAAVARRLGVTTYNGGRFLTDAENVSELDWLLDRLPNRPHTVVYVYLDRHDLGIGDSQAEDGTKESLRARVVNAKPIANVNQIVEALEEYLSDWWNVSPLRIVTQRLDRTMRRAEVLPNFAVRDVVEQRLPDGHRILFRRTSVDRYLNPPDEKTTRRTADYLAWFKDRLQERKLTVYFLLLPSKYNVYAPWLEANEEANTPGVTYLDRLEKELRARGAHVVNGLAVFRRTAAEDLARGSLSFYREDHHWNPMGVERIAMAVAETIQQDRTWRTRHQSSRLERESDAVQ